MAVVPVAILATVAAVSAAGELGEEEGLLDERQCREAGDDRGSARRQRGQSQGGQHGLRGREEGEDEAEEGRSTG